VGLTISYSLGLTYASIEQAREKITRLHHHASDLPLMELGDVTELEGAACCFEEEDPHLNLKYGALRLEGIAHNLDQHIPETKCTKLIGFNVFPGNGCSGTSFGLATYSEAPTSWQWHAYCKTQYASNPEYGGIENFLKSHVSVLKILEFAQQLGILASPRRQTHRDIGKIVIWKHWSGMSRSRISSLPPSWEALKMPFSPWGTAPKPRLSTGLILNISKPMAGISFLQEPIYKHPQIIPDPCGLH
jgi:hypothetical protein